MVLHMVTANAHEKNKIKALATQTFKGVIIDSIRNNKIFCSVSNEASLCSLGF